MMVNPTVRKHMWMMNAKWDVDNLVNAIATDEFGEVKIVNENMHAEISHNRVD